MTRRDEEPNEKNLLVGGLDLGLIVISREDEVLYVSPTAQKLVPFKTGDRVKVKQSDGHISLNCPGKPIEKPLRLQLHRIDWNGKPATLISLRQTGSLVDRELAASQRMLATLFSNLPGMAYRCQNDRDWTMTFVSDYCRDLTGYAPEDLINNARVSYGQVIHPQDRQRVWDEVQAGLREHQPFQLTYRIVTADGQERYVWERGQGVFDDFGELEGLEGLILDISERVKAEERLRLSEARYRAIVEENSELICRFLPDGSLTFVNETFCEYFDLDRSQLMGRSFVPLLHPQDRGEAQQTLDRLAPTMPSPVTLDSRVLLPNGEQRWITWTIQPILDDLHAFLEYQAVGLDITDIKQALASAQESERRLQDVLANIKLAAIILDHHGTLTFCNQHLLDLAGWKADQVLGKNWFEQLLPAEVSQQYYQIFLQASFSGNFPERYEHVIRTSDGSQRLVAWNNTLLHNSQGEIIGLASIGEDITERKWAEKVQAAIFKVSQAAISTDNLMELFRVIHMTLSDLMFAENFFIALYDPVKDLLSFPYYVDQYDSPPESHKPGRGLTEYVLRTGKGLLAPPEVFNRLVEQGEVELIGANSVDWLGVPLKVDNRVIGVMCLQSYSAGVRYQRRDLQMMNFVSNQVAMAIERQRTSDSLNSTSQRYQAVVEASTDAIFLETIDGQVLDCNTAACQMYGYTRDEMLKLWVADLIPGDLAAQLPYFIETQLQNGGLMIEAQGRRKDGSIFPTEISTRVISMGQEKRVVAFVRDITSRKAAEKALRESEARFRSVAQTLGAGIFIHRGGNYLYCNPMWARITGYSEEELLSMDQSQIAPENMSREHRSMLENILEGGTPPPVMEHPIRHKSGEERWINLAATTITYDGEPAIIGTATDITEQKLARERMRLQSAALEAAANAVVIAHPRHGISSVNHAFTELTGYEPEEVFGKEISLLNPDPGQQTTFRELQQTVCSGYVWHGELVGRRKDGSLFHAELTTTPVVSAGGEVTNFVAIIQNITDRKMRELELETIAQLTAALRTAVRRNEIVPVILQEVMRQFQAAGASIVSVLESDQSLYIDEGAGLWQKLTAQKMAAGLGISSQVLATGKPYINNQAREDQHFAYPELLEGVNCLAGLPLFSQGSLRGVLTLGREKPFEANDIRLLTAICNIAAAAIHRADLYDQTLQQASELAQAYDATIEGWARALELRDKETRGHTARVTRLTIQMAEAMGIRGRELDNVRRGVILHDIGKMGVPDSILLKPGELNDEEQRIMHRHPEYAYEMLSPIPYLRDALDIPYCHHEHWDGSGYPRGLAGDEIPLAARIFSIVDVWDALTSDRPYRPAWSHQQALNYIQELAGKQFDPKVVEVFIKILGRKAAGR